MYYLINSKQKIFFKDLQEYLRTAINKDFIFEQIDEKNFYILSSVDLREDIFTIKDLISADFSPINILSSPFLDDKIIIFLKEINIYTNLNYIPLADLLIKRLMKGCLFSKHYLENMFNDIDKELMRSILFFVRNGCNVVSSAKQLYLHRNTLNYRINKFITETSLDLRNIEIQNLLYLYSIICA